VLYPDAAVFSPKIINSNGTEIIGRPPLPLISFLLVSFFRIEYLPKKYLKYINKEGVFMSYNITGCCFMINNELFRSLGFFDERFFFCPEDIALSTKLNNLGYKCYVDSSIIIYHNHAETLKKTMLATFPAMYKGTLIYYANGNIFKYTIIGILLIINFSFSILLLTFSFNLDPDLRERKRQKYINAITTIMSNKSPKEIFISFYNRISS
jgi:GT2 family glycosyltransferase